jgi:hypothetical protein
MCTCKMAFSNAASHNRFFAKSFMIRISVSFFQVGLGSGNIIKHRGPSRLKMFCIHKAALQMVTVSFLRVSSQIFKI